MINKYSKYNIYFSDIETIIDDFNEHIPISLSLIHDNSIQSYNSVIEYLNNIIGLEYNSIIYFHNFGRFDSTFILNSIIFDFNMSEKINVIERNNIIYQLKLRTNKGVEILFRDSYLLIPITLDKLGETFCFNHKKFDDLNYDNITEEFQSNPQKIHNHCINDTLVLQEGFLNFKKSILSEFGINILEVLTLPSLSYNIFRSKYYDFENTPISKNPYKTDEFIRKSYKGGIAEVYKPYLKNGYCYDANSLYPYIMQSCKFPVGKGKFIKGSDINLKNFIGFIECEISTDKELNFLTYRCEKRGLITPKGYWVDVYYHKEILKAIELGYRVKMLRGFKYEKEDHIFTSFITNMYQKRINSTNNSLNYIAKLVMNSLYGRFGMKIFVESTKFLTSQQVFEHKSRYTIRDIKQIGNADLYNVSLIPLIGLDKVNYKNSINTETAVQIASVVTAEARIYMYDFKNIKNNKCYYTDTDSIFLQHKLEEKYVNTKLGGFKLEYEFYEGMFIAPKVYSITDSNNSIIKLVLKGVKVDETHEKLNILEAFRNIIFNNNNFKTYIFNIINSFKRSLNKLTMHKEKHDIVLSFPFNKRVKIFMKGVWVNTRALHIKRFR